MAKKIFLIILFSVFVYNIFSQRNDNYLALLNEASIYIENNFISPFDHNRIIFYNEYWGFGYRRCPFTNEINYFYTAAFGCNIDDNIYSMTDGIITKIGYDTEINNIVIIIKHDDFEIHYFSVRGINLEEDETVKKGQLIGRISSPYYSIGPALILKIKYKEEYFDPHFLLTNVIIR
jgi:murein DD-endopeptidase MepM/ murein hydrolase activator NlpD